MAAENQDLTTCEQYCKKLEREELSKQNFKVLQTDFKYDATTNTYTGTFMNIEIAGQVRLIEEQNILITPNTNTIIANIAYDGTNLVPSITTEQKTVSQVSDLMTSRTFTSSASTCSYTLPIQLDGIGTGQEGDNPCEQLNKNIFAVPEIINRPGKHEQGTFKYNNGTWTVDGLLTFRKGKIAYEKNIVNFTGTGNNLFAKIYARTNNFELEARNFASPKAVEDFVKNNTSNCIYYVPIGFGDGTTALQHYDDFYDVFMGQFKELIITRHYESNMEYTGSVFRIGGNTQGVSVRAGFRNNSFFKPNHDNRGMIVSTSGSSFVSDNINNSETAITLPNTNFMHTDFKGSFGTSQNSFETKGHCVGQSDNGQFREILETSMVVGNGEVAKSFFIKNVVTVPVSVRLGTKTKGLIWLMSS